MLKFLGVQLAHFTVAHEWRLKSTAVLFLVACLISSVFLGTIGFAYIILFTDFWAFPLLYLAWLWYDLGTSERGGRRSEWIRNWRIWSYVRDYFPIHLVKTTDLDPNKNYICGYHPHGYFCFGAFTSFCTTALDLKEIFPKIRPTLLSLHGGYRFPLYRDFALSTGACSVSRDSIHWLLTNQGKGNMVVIVVGGENEIYNAGSGPDVTLILRKRKGFVKMALIHGASLLPIFGFGENETYMTTTNVSTRSIEIFGRRFFPGNFRIMPFRKPVDVIVGKPIDVEKIENPTEDEINHYHNLYIESLTKLFEDHKGNYEYYKNSKLIL